MRKIIKNSNANQVNTFRLHYFPNIPAREERSAPPAGSGTASDAGPDQSPNGQLKPGVGRAVQGLEPAGDEREKLASIAKQAYAEGFAQGEQDAKALSEKQIEPLVATLANVIAELTDTRRKLRHQIESEVVALALQVSRKVVGQALQTNPELVAGIVNAALAHVDDPEKICIRLNPADIKHLQATAGSDLLEANADRIHFEEDSGIDAGGCLVQTEYGEIDARLDKQFQAIEEAFRIEAMGLGTDD